MYLLKRKPEQYIPWNKGKLVGQKPPLKLREIWAIRIRLQLARRTRDLALFNLAIDSKLRACDLVSIRVRDVAQGDQKWSLFGPERPFRNRFSKFLRGRFAATSGTSRV